MCVSQGVMSMSKVSSPVTLISGSISAFVRKFADMRALTEDAVKAYAEAVRARTFPGGDHVYGAKRG